MTAAGRQSLFREGLLLENCRLPFELSVALLNDCPYSCTENGSAMLVTQSSQ